MYECFRFARDERGFSKRLFRGRDGAIDLYDRLAEVGSATVAECKFIGSEAAKEAPQRWADVYRNLANNLPRLYADSQIAPTSPYRAWLDPERPVARYRFCVTAIMSPEEIDALEKRIAADFGQLVTQGVDPLRQLAECDGAVRVLAWNRFEAELDEHPSLAFRWFRGLPVGVDLLANRSGPEPTFRDFLESGALHYFSRNQYVAETGGSLDGGESDFAAGLANGQPNALLITGPGGVGKTRLSLELAASLSSDAYGFDVYRLGRSANFNSVIELAGHYPTDRSVLLLVDYAEAVPALAGIADAVAHLHANTRHRIRLIATCRSSANTLVRDSLAPLDPEERSLSSTRAGEIDYVAWVTRSILSVEMFPDPDGLAEVCHGVPALAAFALFLFRRYREQFDLQFGALHGLGDFDKWFNHRIEMLIEPLSNRREQERALAHIALALPIPEAHFPQFARQWSPLLDSLRTDRWIEYDDQSYHAVHDVFADALAARWLFEAEHVGTDHALELLSVAAERLDLAHALTALERLAQHPRFTEINGRRVIETLLANHREQTKACCGLILGGKLLTFEAKLAVLSRSQALQQVVARERSLDVFLSFLAAEATHLKLKLANVPELQAVSDLLDHACNQPQYSNMILRRAYALHPERFRERALANVDAFALAEPTHFLLVQLLKHGEAPSAIESVVVRWLGRHACAYRATYLYHAWLDVGGGTEAVAEALLAWVDTHGQTERAQFVYTAWLNAGGGTKVVAAGLLAWVDAYGQTEHASFVYAAWLEAKGAFEPIREQVIRWVQVWAAKSDFVYFSKVLTKQSDLPEAIVLAIAGWCTAFPDNDDCLYRLSALVAHLTEGSLSFVGRSALLHDIAKVATSRDKLSIVDRRLIWTLCNLLVDYWHIYNLNPVATIRTMSEIVALGTVFDHDLDHGGIYYLKGSYGAVTMAVRQGLKLGTLCFERDRKGLARFGAWLQAHAPLYLRRLKADFPGDVWGPV